MISILNNTVGGGEELQRVKGECPLVHTPLNASLYVDVITLRYYQQQAKVSVCMPNSC